MRRKASSCPWLVIGVSIGEGVKGAVAPVRLCDVIKFGKNVFRDFDVDEVRLTLLGFALQLCEKFLVRLNHSLA